MAESKVLFVSDRETFIVQSIIKKLQTEGVESSFLTLDMNSLTKAKGSLAPLVCFYIDDSSNYDPDVMVYFRLSEKSERVCHLDLARMRLKDCHDYEV